MQCNVCRSTAPVRLFIHYWHYVIAVMGWICGHSASIFNELISLGLGLGYALSLHALQPTRRPHMLMIWYNLRVFSVRW